MRPLILVGILVAIGGLAFVVTRTGAGLPAATPYVGKRGGSRTNASGLGVSLRRESDVRPLAPGTPVRAGDELHFTVRAEGPRYLLVRLRDGADAATTIFPPGAAEASLVRPGEALPVPPPVAPGAGKVVVTAVFADRAFSLATALPDDAETIDLVMEKE